MPDQKTGQPVQPAAGWTVDTLRIYIEHEIDSIRAQVELRHETETRALEHAFSAHQTAMDAAMEAQEKAIDKAERANEKRFESVNEFRAQLSDQAATFMPRSESVAKHEATGEKLDAQVSLVSNSMAELRAQMNDLAVRFMPRAEAEAHDTATLDRLREIELRMQGYPTREETAIALTAADSKSAASVATMSEKIEQLNKRMDLNQGKSSGYTAIYGWAIAGVGLVISVILMANGVFGGGS